MEDIPHYLIVIYVHRNRVVVVTGETDKVVVEIMDCSDLTGVSCTRLNEREFT
jgi:hypothetical protein